VRAYGKLSAPGSPEDLSGLHITTEEAQALSSDKLLDDMNLTASELASFRTLRGDSTQAIRERLRELLLSRYQSYRAFGLAGIAPYDRGGRGVVDVASDLTKPAERPPRSKNTCRRCMRFSSTIPRLTARPARELPLGEVHHSGQADIRADACCRRGRRRGPSGSPPGVLRQHGLQRRAVRRGVPAVAGGTVVLP
jgi:hypothetical protein